MSNLLLQSIKNSDITAFYRLRKKLPKNEMIRMLLENNCEAFIWAANNNLVDVVDTIMHDLPYEIKQMMIATNDFEAIICAAANNNEQIIQHLMAEISEEMMHLMVDRVSNLIICYKNQTLLDAILPYLKCEEDRNKLIEEVTNMCIICDGNRRY